MIASSFTDPVLGLDVHFEMVPTPAPTPTPIPNPFTGVVFDPVGLAAGLAIGAAVSAVLGAPILGPVFYWTAFPATNTGTEAKHVPGHILIPPGVSWAPFPKTPKPVIHPGETPTPAAPIKPEDDAVVVFGSKSVTVMGSNAVRLGDIALSCSEPVRLPSSVVVAVPKGAPILIGGPSSLDIMAAVMASLRTRFVSDSLHAALSRLKPSRFRNFLHRAVCFFTGHPVDVATGKVMTEAVDLELPGPLPLRFERVYSSASASRKGPLGNGWSHSWDQAIWRERGKVVFRDGDGREIEFDTFDFPEHEVAPGQSVHNPIERLTLKCEPAGRWRIIDHYGRQREFLPVPGRGANEALIVAHKSRDGRHVVTFEYDASGWLTKVVDVAGREIAVRNDRHGRITALLVPFGGSHQRRRAYTYDDDGDLVSVTDAVGAAWSFQYSRHLLVRETDRTGLSFYFQYDGLGEDAFCVRTWGDRGIYDHVLAYDKQKRVTFVTDSRGNTTEYRCNLVGQVVEKIDPLRGSTRYSYDPQTLRLVEEEGPGGHTVTQTYDDRGNVAQIDRSDGSQRKFAYGPFNQLCELINEAGTTRSWAVDSSGQIRTAVDQLGRQCAYSYRNGLMCRISRTDGAVMVIEHGPDKLPQRVSMPNGAQFVYTYDELGRMTSVRGPGRTGRTLQYDAEGRVVRENDTLGLKTEYRYDGEGNLLQIVDPGRQIQFRYGEFHNLVAREEAGARAEFEYDTEGNVLRLRTPNGESIEYAYDACNRVQTEVDALGLRTDFVRDPAGRVVTRRVAGDDATAYQYDAGARLARLERSDGRFLELEYAVDGSLVRAANDEGVVVMERDAVGRRVREYDGSIEVNTTHAPNGERSRGWSSAGQWSSYGHDEHGGPAWMRVTEVGAETDARAVQYRRDEQGYEVQRWLPGGITVTWARDWGGRPTRRAVYRRTDTGNELIADRRWTWEGEVATAVADMDGLRRSFRRDRLGRVVAEVDGDDAPRERPAQGKDWERAAGGRVLHGPPGTYEYDERGRRTAKVEADGRRWSYEWNSDGLLAAVIKPDGTRLEFDYDAMGRRIAKRRFDPIDGVASPDAAAEVRFVWDGDSLVHEFREGQPTVTWYWDLDSFGVVARECDGELVGFVADPLGAPVAAYDEGGQERWWVDRDVAGRSIAERGDGTLCPWRMLGQYEDEETGLYYNRFRYYDPECGQYISPDPLGFQSGSFAIYDYVDDPLSWADPLGLIQGPTQVPYDNHDLFDGPGGVRETAGAMSNADSTKGNMAVAMLDDGTMVPMMSESPAGRPQRPRNVFHSEFKLLNGDIVPSRIVALYTEREPCPRCLADLRQLLGDDVPVTFTYPHVPGQESAVSRQIRDQRRACR